MSFQAVGPEEPMERSAKLVVQDRGTSSLFASAERNRERPGTWQLANITGDARESNFLFQQLSVALQRGNAVSFQNTFTAS